MNTIPRCAVILIAVYIALSGSRLAEGSNSVAPSKTSAAERAAVESSDSSLDALNRWVDAVIDGLISPPNPYTEVPDTRKYETEWVARHAIMPDQYYCVPLGDQQIYAARPYKWIARANVVLIFQDGLGRREKVTVPAPEEKYSQTANWKFNDGTWDQNLPRNLAWQAPMHATPAEKYNVYCQCMLIQGNQHSWTVSLNIKGVLVAGYQVTVPPNKIFSDITAVDEVTSYRYCQCTMCQGACVNNVCMGGCRDQYPPPPAGPRCNTCNGAVSCCYSEHCPFWASGHANDCNCRFVLCGEHPQKKYCATHGMCSYCYPQDALASLQPPVTYKVLAACEPAWLAKTREVIAVIARWAKG